MKWTAFREVIFYAVTAMVVVLLGIRMNGIPLTGRLVLIVVIISSFIAILWGWAGYRDMRERRAAHKRKRAE